jgi:hypothetical protein
MTAAYEAAKAQLVSSTFSRTLVLTLLACVSDLIAGAHQAEPERKDREVEIQEPLRIAQAHRVDHAPKLDGTLDDPLWQQATAITNFLQREPYEGQTPTEKTEVRVLYTSGTVFFGVLCFDSDYQGIIATELRRDVSQELDDYFEIVIDSAHDRRNAYVFQFNPLGTQRDALITEEQKSEEADGDPAWDGVLDFGRPHHRPRLDCHNRYTLFHFEFHAIRGCGLGNQFQTLHPKKK